MELESSHNSPKFDREWVQVLINLKMKYSKWFTGQRNSATEGWKLIFDELKAIGAPSYLTAIKLKKKWMNLMTRYKQIKINTINTEKITWPYFEQIDRAFGKKFINYGEMTEKKINFEDKQDFINKLIQVRCENKYLFTGKKYTAVEGWKFIIKQLNCENRYSVQQINKCWQNLVQKYKQMLKTENNELFWPYFDSMQKWFLEDGNSSATEENKDLIIETTNKPPTCCCMEKNTEILQSLKEIRECIEQLNEIITNK